VALTRNLRFDLANNPRLTYRAPLDGVRALAILAVMLYHLDTRPIFPGGTIGVDVFFVLSGFLITTLLLQEWAVSGGISLRRFYMRRALRLMPAVAVYLAVYLFIAIGFRGFEFSGGRSADVVLANVASIATYSYNWFIGLERERALGLAHLWSLSVEEQFYLAWPFFLLLLLRLRLPALAVMAISLGLVVLSALEPLLLGAPFLRLYYGTDFRLQGLVLGGLLAQLYVSGLLRPAVTQSPVFHTVLALSLLTIAAVVLLVHDYADFLFSGGHSLVAACSAVLISAVIFPRRSLVCGLLANPVLVYVGQRSYALYLWHWSIGSWLRGLDAAPQVVLSVALTFLAAELSYRLVERPALNLKSRFKPAGTSIPAQSPAALDSKSRTAA
jgi:peptidoglycan/LPS O-acetylase OafA/YrhL